MTIVEKTYKIKSFDEFTKEEQEKILEKYRDINIYDDLTNMDEVFYLDIDNAGFKSPKIYYDLSCCQGSGASFECDEIDFRELIKEFDCKHKAWLLSYLEQYCIGRVISNRYSNHYCHERTREVNFDNYCNYEYKRIEKLVNEFFDYVEHKRYKLSCELYKNLSNYYDELQSDENVKDCLLANEYLFNENTLEIEN